MKGWFGLAAAKTYIELHPSENVVVFDAAATIGGVWAAHRLYPGLKSNNLLGTYEYPDFKMGDRSYGIQTGEHIPGPVLHQYLTEYTKEYGIYDRIRLNIKIDTVEPAEKGGWLLKTTHTSTSESAEVKTKRLIVATGLTSEPYVPHIPGVETFQGQSFHSKDFAQHEDTLTKTEKVVIIGGAKSAWDVAYAYATAGAQVDMVIRSSGHGPEWMIPPFVTPLKKQLEKLVHTRFLTWLSPCIWGHEDGYGGIRQWLHNTIVGRFFVRTFWKILAADVMALNQYDSHPELKKLKPWTSAFHLGGSLGLLNYPTSIFDLVRKGQVRIWVDEITRLEHGMIRLASGQTLSPDVLVYATGWKKGPPFRFLKEDRIGLYRSLTEIESLMDSADENILAHFPELRSQPERTGEVEAAMGERMQRPLRLYRFMVPPTMASQRDIAFAGMLSIVSTSVCAQVQALWISAFFDGKLERLSSSEKELQWQTVLHTQFSRWRHPNGYGLCFPDLVFEGIPYYDMLLHDLGLETRRKKGRIAEITEAYGPEDYVDLVGEWRRKQTG